MILPFFFAALGLLILLLAGDVLVRGAVNLSLKIGVPALIVSFTIVAFGTSAPELLISVQSVLEGVPGLALGNVVGSNTANVLMVLGIPALISTLDAPESDTRKSYLIMFGSSVLFVGLSAMGVLTAWQGVILLIAMALILGDQVREAYAHARAGGEEEEIEEADLDMPGWKIGVYLILGLIGLPVGADLLVDNATEIAREYEVSETVIGLTLVALGTSLPELATTVMAAIRRHAEVAIGNVIGSNLFNLLAIMGVTTLVGPVPVGENFFAFDFWVMLGASAILAPFVFKRLPMGRVIGLGLTVLYILYLFCVFAKG